MNERILRSTYAKTIQLCIHYTDLDMLVGTQSHNVQYECVQIWLNIFI